MAEREEGICCGIWLLSGAPNCSSVKAMWLWKKPTNMDSKAATGSACYSGESYCLHECLVYIRLGMDKIKIRSR